MISIKRDLMKYLLSQNVIVGNLTKYDTNQWNSSLLKDSSSYDVPHLNKVFRLKLFNDEEIHSELNIIFANIVLSYIYSQKNPVNSEEIFNKRFDYIILFLSFISLLILIILFYCIPTLINFKTVIYKTKNMLTIVPIHILAAQRNIRNVLNIPKHY